MQNISETYYWKANLQGWAVLLLASALLFYIFRESFDFLTYMWFNKEEYSHAVMIPFISAFLIWQKKDVLQKIPFEGSWAGLVVMLCGVLLLFLGKQSALAIIVHYSFLVMLYGIALAYMGWRGFRVILVPLLILVFMIPLPGFLYQGLSNKLQLLSSELGVWFIRLFDISVYLEGNVIDLGTYKLQVVEACSGLRYLFPLVTLGFIAAYFFKGALWKRAIIFLSSIPITILMNSFRVGVIGVLVEYWGQGMAEGFLHDFEGWVVFMACTAVLIGEMWLLAHIGTDRRPLREVFGLDFPEAIPETAEVRKRRVPRQFRVITGLLGLIVVLSALMPQQKEIIPARKDFSTFPLSVGEWKGRPNPLEQIYVDALRFDDHIQADYLAPQGGVVSLFTSYYASQIQGNMPHSPRACLPGGGWIVSSLGQTQLEGVSNAGQPVKVNRVVIERGESKQLVYYWFQQRGRTIYSEYAVKWYVFWDSLTRNRSDGSLVRLVTMIGPGETMADGDRRLERFAAALAPVLPDYVPD